MQTKINYNGLTLTLIEDAYIAGSNQEPHYQALAQDTTGDSYLVRWDITSESDNEDERCDWANPSDVVKR